eukprot:gene5782-4133_t
MKYGDSAQPMGVLVLLLSCSSTTHKKKKGVRCALIPPVFVSYDALFLLFLFIFNLDAVSKVSNIKLAESIEKHYVALHQETTEIMLKAIRRHPQRTCLGLLLGVLFLFHIIFIVHTIKMFNRDDGEGLNRGVPRHSAILNLEPNLNGTVSDPSGEEVEHDQRLPSVDLRSPKPIHTDPPYKFDSSILKQMWPDSENRDAPPSFHAAADSGLVMKNTMPFPDDVEDNPDFPEVYHNPDEYFDWNLFITRSDVMHAPIVHNIGLEGFAGLRLSALTRTSVHMGIEERKALFLFHKQGNTSDPFEENAVSFDHNRVAHYFTYEYNHLDRYICHQALPNATAPRSQMPPASELFARLILGDAAYDPMALQLLDQEIPFDRNMEYNFLNHFCDRFVQLMHLPNRPPLVVHLHKLQVFPFTVRCLYFRPHALTTATRKFVVLGTEIDEPSSLSFFFRPADINPEDFNKQASILYLLNHPLLVHWYSTNGNIWHPKFSAVPIGFQFYYRSGSQLPMNNNIKKEFSKLSPDLIFGIGTGIGMVPEYGQGQYYQTITEHSFVVSPPGNGYDCFRTWEALALGGIPIIQNPVVLEGIMQQVGGRGELDSGREVDTRALLEPYRDLPVVYIDMVTEMNEENMLKWRREIYHRSKKGVYKLEKLFLQYWVDRIYGHTNDEVDCIFRCVTSISSSPHSFIVEGVGNKRKEYTHLDQRSLLLLNTTLLSLDSMALRRTLYEQKGPRCRVAGLLLGMVLLVLCCGLQRASGEGGHQQEGAASPKKRLFPYPQEAFEIPTNLNYDESIEDMYTHQRIPHPEISREDILHTPLVSPLGYQAYVGLQVNRYTTSGVYLSPEERGAIGNRENDLHLHSQRRIQARELFEEMVRGDSIDVPFGLTNIPDKYLKQQMEGTIHQHFCDRFVSLLHFTYRPPLQVQLFTSQIANFTYHCLYDRNAELQDKIRKFVIISSEGEGHALSSFQSLDPQAEDAERRKEAGPVFLLEHPALVHWYTIHCNIRHPKVTALPKGFLFYHRSGKNFMPFDPARRNKEEYRNTVLTQYLFQNLNLKSLFPAASGAAEIQFGHYSPLFLADALEVFTGGMVYAPGKWLSMATIRNPITTVYIVLVPLDYLFDEGNRKPSSTGDVLVAPEVGGVKSSGPLYEYLKAHPELSHMTSGAAGTEEYYAALNRFAFVACPLGESYDSSCIWEALVFGAIPLVEVPNFSERIAQELVLDKKNRHRSGAEAQEKPFNAGDAAVDSSTAAPPPAQFEDATFLDVFKDFPVIFVSGTMDITAEKLEVWRSNVLVESKKRRYTLSKLFLLPWINGILSQRSDYLFFSKENIYINRRRGLNFCVYVIYLYLCLSANECSGETVPWPIIMHLNCGWFAQWRRTIFVCFLILLFTTYGFSELRALRHQQKNDREPPIPSRVPHTTPPPKPYTPLQSFLWPDAQHRNASPSFQDAMDTGLVENHTMPYPALPHDFTSFIDTQYTSQSYVDSTIILHNPLMMHFPLAFSIAYPIFAGFRLTGLTRSAVHISMEERRALLEYQRNMSQAKEEGAPDKLREAVAFDHERVSHYFTYEYSHHRTISYLSPQGATAPRSSAPPASEVMARLILGDAVYDPLAAQLLDRHFVTERAMHYNVVNYVCDRFVELMHVPNRPPLVVHLNKFLPFKMVLRCLYARPNALTTAKRKFVLLGTELDDTAAKTFFVEEDDTPPLDYPEAGKIPVPLTPGQALGVQRRHHEYTSIFLSRLRLDLLFPHITSHSLEIGSTTCMWLERALEVFSGSMTSNAFVEVVSLADLPARITTIYVVLMPIERERRPDRPSLTNEVIIFRDPTDPDKPGPASAQHIALLPYTAALYHTLLQNPYGGPSRSMEVVTAFHIHQWRWPWFNWINTTDIGVFPGQSQRDFYEQSTKSVFVVSPPGKGFECFRTWEALALGAIPIVQNPARLAKTVLDAWNSTDLAKELGADMVVRMMEQVGYKEELEFSLARLEPLPGRHPNGKGKRERKFVGRGLVNVGTIALLVAKENCTCVSFGELCLERDSASPQNIKRFTCVRSFSLVGFKNSVCDDEVVSLNGSDFGLAYFIGSFRFFLNLLEDMSSRRELRSPLAKFIFYSPLRLSL